MTAVTFNPTQSRYELEENGETVIANIRRDGNVLHIDYVEAPQALRGTGAAGRMMEGLADIARKENLKIVPLCGYAASWLKRHNEYADLLD